MCQSRATHKHNLTSEGNTSTGSAITATTYKAMLCQRSNDIEHSTGKVCNNLHGQVKNDT